MTRNEVISEIKAALKRRSRKSWSVTGGRGTVYGWIRISAPPKRCIWKHVQTHDPKPPQEGAVYRGAMSITPHYAISDGTVTSYENDSWAQDAARDGQTLVFNWDVESPDAKYGHMSPQDRKELADLLGLENVSADGVSIAASTDYYNEYLARAKGETPKVIAQPYWD